MTSADDDLRGVVSVTDTHDTHTHPNTEDDGEGRTTLTLDVYTLLEIQADAWDAGHKTRWKRGPNECRCAAWSASECACGRYGTGPLLSLEANPYRQDTP